MVWHEALTISSIAVEHEKINVEKKAMNTCAIGFFSNKECEWMLKQQWSKEIKKILSAFQNEATFIDVIFK